MGIPKDGLQNLANTLEGDKDLNSPRELSAETEKELAIVEKTIREAHVNRVNPELKCILVILPSRHSPTGILIQREDVILEWIFLPCKPNKKLKTYIEKISDLIHKGKLRLCQLIGMDPAEIIVPLTHEEVSSLWKDNKYWQRACSNFLGEINNHYPKSKRIEFIKKTEWVLPHIVRQKPISGVLTFYTDANKLGKAGYKSGDLSKVVQSPYNSVQKAELYAILMVLMDFTEPLNIVTDSQYAERVVLHIETAEFIPDNTELTSLFIQLQEIIRNREHPIYIIHIRSHTGLPGPLAQGLSFPEQLRKFWVFAGRPVESREARIPGSEAGQARVTAALPAAGYRRLLRELAPRQQSGVHRSGDSAQRSPGQRRCSAVVAWQCLELVGALSGKQTFLGTVYCLFSSPQPGPQLTVLCLELPAELSYPAPCAIHWSW
ncbi:hypothetical protein STEG23_013971, partial [Scotinomys teguina]